MKNIVSQLRKTMSISQSKLAYAVGVTRQTITSIEIGKYTPSLELAFKIAHHFNMRVEDIFFM